ncbi:BREX-1 system adenine-specific DNA-methyltransferase PglX [Prosthecobacter sp.]|uniref:BREX-1 system adenine-specific DNA-methyltransferase PglX n=1 Tax=Prosthecobacter sp. TaxID=1965333 RepID=UPI002AB871D3|nr:BREX-1 system adenine-specific DNA-methyltransferase PglX [Prosthecobacter sp.]MDZ4405296.1 BREX-1 system adenine-specific DNA-methyltransferase PglX [Prosthecobacter sp.]
MNTSALKTFAPAVRKQLMEAVTRKLDFALTAQTPDYLTTFAPQVAALRKLAQADRPGLNERVAYTWFNRLAALRFMDARGWHPFRARVLTPASAAETQPELLKLTRTGALPEELKSHTDSARLNDLLDGRIPSPDAQGEVYRHLVLAACRFYHALLPNLFEKLDDETELLLPDDLLTEHSVVHGFRTEISDEDCGDGQRANVEILGWLYQFYISERKDQVMARKSAVPTEDIPAVTQLFTPHWIVRYLVENSLGRLWLLNRPGSRLREHMPYYIAGENNAPGGSPDDFLKITKPEEIRLCDPAVGSGHMLTYAFDLLTLIYEEEGHAPTEIPALILRHNLHGLEICPRAAQLAELALVFKAREKSRRFFQPEHLVRPRIIELRDVRFAENELRDYIRALGLGDLFNQPMLRLLHQFEEAKNFGSLIQPCLDERAIADVRRAIEAKDLGGQLFLRETHLKVLRVLEQAEALTQRYHVIAANPPYMAAAAMNPQLKDFVETNWEAGKADTYSAFILRNLKLAYCGGRVAMITTPNWMFLKGFESLREQLLQETHISSLVHCGRGVWGGDFGSCAFVIQSSKNPEMPGVFKRLFKRPGEIQSNEEIEANFFNVADFPNYTATSSSFRGITGLPIAYWISKAFINVFQESEPLIKRFQTRLGLSTANNERFLRLWFEVAPSTIKMDAPSRDIALKSGKRWFPYQKGGAFRKWFGNGELLVDWSDDGREIKNFGADQGRIRSHNYNLDYIFREGVTWSDVTSGRNAFRYMPSGQLFDGRGSSGFAIGDTNWRVVLGLLNTSLSYETIGFINPTIAINVGEIGRIPYHKSLYQIADRIVSIVDECIFLARADWDNFETSWDFRDQPLLRPGLKGATLEASWRNWEAQSTAAIRRMQELETENNRLFIAAYGLDGELQPEVPEAQITLARAEARRDLAAFLSYAVGCMMGRYSPDHPGLILANAGDSLREFLEKVGKPLAELTFAPDEDGIVPVLDGEWFEDDIVARTRDFLRATFGEATLRENLRFIEDSLGKDLRKYFLNDFYKDHLQTYKKRPIYWLVQSPKKGFSVLLYLHRYTRDTMNLVLNRYLRDYQVKLRNRLPHLVQEQATASTAKAKTDARKEADKLTKILTECEEWERQTMLPLAQARIELDLDDGVKTNYLKLGEALAPIAGLAAKEED